MEKVDLKKSTIIQGIMSNAIKKHPAYKNTEYKWSLDDFDLGSRLGRGKFGRVFCAREKSSGLIVALKTIHKKDLVEGKVEKQILREIEIQTHLDHPNILKLHTWFYDDHRIYLVLEYAGQGELFGHLTKQVRFSEHISAKYTYQVADALHYCHQHNVIHRDIKPENLLLSITGDVKLADFGWSVHAPSRKRETMCGTLDYLPPEMVRGQQYSTSIDNWCLGVLCYEFLVGSPPFESKTSNETYEKIRNVAVKYPSHVTSGAKDLIDKLLRKDPRERISLPQVMKHFWIVQNM